MEEKYDLSNAQNEDILHILCRISGIIDECSYGFSGIETKKIKDFAKKISKGTGLKSLISSLESISNSDLKKELESACKTKDFIPIAESYFIHSILTECSVPFKLSPGLFKCAIKPKSDSRPGKIVFMAKYKEWAAIKKLSLEGSKDYEISAILSSINFTIINKSFEFAGLIDDAKIDSLIKGKRKSFSALIECLKSINESDEKKLSYIVCKVCENIGYTPYSTPNMLTKAYPDIKPPKVKGRIAK